jgi:carbamoyltransferase
MLIVGISAFYHDSAVAVVENGKILFAVQEERLSRVKHDSGFPHRALKEAFKFIGCTPQKVDAFVFYEKPFLKFERLLENYLSFSPRGFFSFYKALPLWIKEKLFQKDLLIAEISKLGLAPEEVRKRIFFSNHHLSHAASAFYPSGLEEALVLTMDGVGEWATTTVYRGRDSELTLLREIRYPHSLGLLYSAFTYYCGFKVNSGEYKLMGLAPYGQPRFAEAIRTHLIDIKPDGSFRLNLQYFSYPTELRMTNKHFDQLFGGCQREPEGMIEQVHMDLAASVQVVLEEVILKMAQNLRQDYGLDQICLAGGVALNCVANGKLQRSGLFRKIWIQPAAGDAGGALGAALAYHYSLGSSRAEKSDSMSGAALGPEFSDEEIERALFAQGLTYRKMTRSEMLSFVAQQLAADKAIGWFQGRMEYGPRALGSRSILASPLRETMQRDLNLKIKFRESFRPFAPVVLEDKVGEWFDFKGPSPYMLMVAPVLEEHRIAPLKSLEGALEKLNQKRSSIPAVTHVDYSARLQTINDSSHPLLSDLVREFEKLTGTPILVNTSFNVRGEPIVATPDQAVRCFLGTDLDLLVCGTFVVCKTDQKQQEKKTYHEQFSLD